MRTFHRVIDNVYVVWFQKTDIQKSNFVKPTSYRSDIWIENDGICQFRDSRNYGKHVFGALEAENDSRVIFNSMARGVHNKALRVFDDRASTIDNLYEAWFERQQALDQLVDITGEILTFVRYWRRPEYWKHLKGTIKPDSLPNAWLQWQFGLKPLIGTFDSAFKFLGAPLHGVTIKASGRDSVSKLSDENGRKLVFNATMIERLQAKLEPNKNPNARFLQIAGLNQPFSTAFSVIPWGWAVDYFVNASEMMSNLEVKHPGLLMINQQTTTVKKCDWSGHSVLVDRYKNRYYTANGTGYSVNRSLSINHNFSWEFSFPLLGSNQAANLLSALALSMKKG